MRCWSTLPTGSPATTSPLGRWHWPRPRPSFRLALFTWPSSIPALAGRAPRWSWNPPAAYSWGRTTASFPWRRDHGAGPSASTTRFSAASRSARHFTVATSLLWPRAGSPGERRPRMRGRRCPRLSSYPSSGTGHLRPSVAARSSTSTVLATSSRRLAAVAPRATGGSTFGSSLRPPRWSHLFGRGCWCPGALPRMPRPGRDCGA